MLLIPRLWVQSCVLLFLSCSCCCCCHSCLSAVGGIGRCNCRAWLVLVADGWKEQGPACGLARHTTCACRAEVFRSVSQCNPDLPAVCCLLLCCCVAVL